MHVALRFLLFTSLLPSPLQGPSDPAADLILLADAGGDGDVTAEEWASFLGTLDADAAGALDARSVLARLVFTDQDGDGRLTPADVEAALSDSASTAGFFLAALADAEGDGDGAASAAEGAAFAARASQRAGPDGALPFELRVEWIRAVEALPPPPPEDRGRRVPPVVLAALLPALDADSSGALSLTDLNALHRGADANGDGVVTGAELATRQAAVFTRWEVDPEAKNRPPLMPWQRTLEDALALVQATGKPLLVCVNIDGENASETLAYGRYRDPAFAELASGFIPVLASPDRREPLERDDRGRRLPDRRFGRLLNSEHIDIEPKLFELYFRGNRVAPRHLGVGPDGEILFDLYLLQDLGRIDAKLAEVGVATPPAPDPASLSLDALFASPDATNREELERRFVEGGEELRRALAPRALASARSTQQPELVHLALRDPSPAVRRLGALELASDPALFPLDLVPAAMAEVAGDEAAEELLLTGLAQAAQGEDARAADARLLRQGLQELRAARSGAAGDDPLELDRFRLLGGGAAAAEPVPSEADFEPAVAQLERLDEALKAAPDDVALLLGRLELLVRLARIRLGSGGNPTYFLQDASRAADDVLERDPENARALALKAFAIYRMNNVPEGGAAAARALPHLVREATSPLAGEVLGILAAARTQAVYDALSVSKSWPQGGAAEAVRAYEALLARPGAPEDLWVRYLDLLGTLRDHAGQRALVRRALAALPTSERLHGYLRFVELRDRGASALEAAYGEEPFASAPAGAAPALLWYHGLATLLAAEHQVLCRDTGAARAAYAASGERFAASAEAEPGFASSAAHYRCLALAGLARLQQEAGELADACRSLEEAFRMAPASVQQEDGLGNSPAETARELRQRCMAQGEDELAAELEGALGEAGFTF